MRPFDMPTFQVQLWPDGKWDQKDYVKVDAATKKEAAEKVYGKPLSDKGSNYQMRARVHSSVARGSATIFYDRDA
jgi:hypothetical protein